MGHAGAFTLPGESDALTKIKHLEDVGVTVVNHPSKLGDTMKILLGNSGRASSGAATSGSGVSQRRGLHTLRRVRPRVASYSFQIEQRRNLHIAEDQALGLLRERGINASVYSGKGRKHVSVSLPRKFTLHSFLSNVTKPISELC